MLKVLKKILQEIHAADDFNAALETMVSRIREALETDACSIFLLDQNTREFVLAATDGLNQASVGKIRLKLGEGIIGLIAEREEPINLEQAQLHPNFSAFPEIGEDKLNAYLGVPIIYQRELQGVISVQQKAARKFDQTEEALLVTVAAQLGSTINNAENSGALNKLFNDNTNLYEEVCLEGIPSAPGVGIGYAVIVYPLADLDAIPDRQVENIGEQIAIFQRALDKTRDDIASLMEKLSDHLPSQELALFEAYLAILSKNGLGDEIVAEIKKGFWAQGALRKVVQRHIRQFEALDDPYLSERASDVRDLGLRMLAYLQENQQPDLDYPEQTILIGEDISAAALAEVPEGKLAGLVCLKGSMNSHVAILARALGIPTVMGLEGLNFQRTNLDKKLIIVDGYYGQIYISPSVELQQEFEILAQEERELNTNLSELRNLPATTPDGHTISLFVNTGFAADSGLALSVGAEGVGLFRTEVPFMVRDSFPAEEEQKILYRQLLNAFAPRPVIMRTLDIGGDKNLPYFPIEEKNPYLGWRGIRVTLDHPEVFLVQIRAMLKASIGFNNLRILLPMVSVVKEVSDALELLEQAYIELTQEGYNIQKPPIGIMLEVPSAIYLIQHFAKRVDFFSVGTNDLIQYVLAVDRNNSHVANLYDALHPSMIRVLMHIIEACKLEGKPVSICGEMASDPAAVIILLALGFKALSMNSVSLLRVKWIIRTLTISKARQLLNEVLNFDDPGRIRYHLEQALEEAGLGGLIRAGK